MAKNPEEIEEKIEEKFSFIPNSSRAPIERYYHDKRPIKEPECYPSPTTPAYDPSKEIKISLVTDQYPERCTRHVFRSSRDNLPTIYLPRSWMLLWGIDWIHKENAMDLVKLEMSADREVITMRRVPNPPGMNKPVDHELFSIDSDDYARELEEKKENEEQKQF